MAEVGAYYITIMPDMSKFTGAVNSAMGSGGTEAGNKFSTGFGSIIGGTAIGSMLSGLATRVGSSIMSGLSAGINRIDTIQNFPKVMESLGYTSEAASNSVALIMEHLDGLPSATQDVVGLTQAIADSTGDLDLATKAALGFNDMMLANGASAAEITQAQGVFNRVLGKGNATVAQWQSLQSVMPAQLAAVARQLLGEGASVEELRDQLNDGTVSWNDFLGAIVELDENGYVNAAGKQISSFADQARANSVGIGTAIANIRNRIGAGWADILDSIGREDISHAIDTMSYGIRDAMKRVGDAIDYLKERIGQTPIAENAAKVLSAISEAISSIWNDGGPEILKTLADALVNLIDGALQWMADNADVVKAAVWGIAGALAALAGFKLGTELAKLPAIIGGIGTALSANPLLIGVTVFAALAAAAYGFFTKTETGRAIVEKFVNGCKELWANLKDEWNRTVEKIKQNLADNAVQWNKFKDNVAKAVNNIKKAVVDKWNEIKRAVSKYTKEAVDSFKKNWEESCKKVTDTISGFVKGATDRWNSLKKSVTDTVNGLKAALIDRWNAIKSSVTGTIDSIKAAVKEKWDAIKSTVTGIIDSLKAAVKEKWDAIKATISGVINAVRDTIKGVLDKIKAIWDSIFGGMKDDTRTTFNGIKGIVSGAVGVVKTTVGGLATALGTTWNGIKTAAGKAWDSIKTTASTKWDGIKSTLSTKAEGVKNAIQNKLSGVVGKLKEYGTNAGQALADALTGKKTNVQNAAKGLYDAQGKANRSGESKTWGTKLAQKIAEGINGDKWRVTDSSDSLYYAEGKADRQKDSKSWGSNLAKNLSSGISGNSKQVSDSAWGLYYAQGNADRQEDGKTWGRHLVENIAAGINDTIWRVEEAAKEAAKAQKKYLGQTVAEAGPLHDTDVWGLHMMQNITEGIRKGIPMVEREALRAAQAVDDTLNADATRAYAVDYAASISRSADEAASAPAGGVLVTGNNFYVRNDRDIDAIADAINQKAERERRAAL